MSAGRQTIAFLSSKLYGRPKKILYRRAHERLGDHHEFGFANRVTRRDRRWIYRSLDRQRRGIGAKPQEDPDRLLRRMGRVLSDSLRTADAAGVERRGTGCARGDGMGVPHLDLRGDSGGGIRI